MAKQEYNTTPKTTSITEALWRLQKIILSDLDFDEVVNKIVNGLLDELGYLNLGYRIVVLTLADEKKNVLKRVSLSSTAEAKKAMEASAVPFHDIDIPLSAHNNLLIKTYKDKKPHKTTYWPDIFVPVLTKEEALTNQHASGIKTSMLYPIVVREKSIGVLIFSMVKEEKDVSEEEKELIRGFTDIVGLAVQNSQLYTSLAETTKKLKKANARLKELDKQKDEFVSVASHELRTPMTAIRGYLWLALNKSGDKIDPTIKHHLEVSYDSTIRLINLVNDMLTISRLERKTIEIKKEPIDIVPIVRAVYDELKIQADEKNIAFEIIHDDKPYEIDGDKDKLRDVFQNLVGNALKFTLEGHVKITCSRTDTQIKVAVEDTGPGIRKEDRDKLFGKFAKLDHAYKNISNVQGTGLGLYITKKIVSLHGGDITVQSEVDQGTTFTVTLPAR